jgi:hypothetical protein
MIYNEVPLKYRYIPINIECDLFVTVFMCYFSSYLGWCANSLMAVLDNEDGLYDHFSEGKLLEVAEWAKDVYRQKEKIHPLCERFHNNYVTKHKYTNNIIENINSENFEFDFSDHSCENINDGIIIFNSIIKKWREINFIDLFEDE